MALGLHHALMILFFGFLAMCQGGTASWHTMLTNPLPQPTAQLSNHQPLPPGYWGDDSEKKLVAVAGADSRASSLVPGNAAAFSCEITDMGRLTNAKIR